MKKTTSRIGLILVVLALTTLACRLLFNATEDEPAISQPDEPAPQAESGESAETELNGADDAAEEAAEPAAVPLPIRQWASSATASSEYTNTTYSAQQATGAPDTPDCGDKETAWASYEGYSVEWLEVSYDTPVTPAEINIYESHTPTQVVKVELVDTAGTYHQVYMAEPRDTWECPFILTIAVDNADYQAISVRITVDQSTLDLPWDEIDAVELVGYAAGETESGTAVGEGETPSRDISAGESAGDVVIPDSLLWRVNEDSLGIELGTFGDLAVTADDRIYIPDNLIGVLIFDKDGDQVGTIEHDELINPKDIKVGPDGNLYIADNFANSVLTFTPDGEFVSGFGENGNGPGQFGTFGPKAIAVSSDNTIYALDDNRDEDDNPFTRILVFSKSGEYLSEIPFDDEYIVGMDFGPDGYLYTVDFFGGLLQKRDAQGNVVAEIGTEALKGTNPQYVDFDNAGNIYVTIWDEPGVVILDPVGNFMGRFGYEEEPDVSPWPDGAMNQPTGIAVLGDGSIVIFADYANQQPILEAINLR